MKGPDRFLVRLPLAFPLLGFLLTTALIAAASKGPLARDTALAILKKSATCIKRGDFLDQESVLQLEAHCVVPSKDTRDIPLKRAQAQLKFLQLMASIGILQEGATSNIELGAPNKYHGTYHNFRVVPQPDVGVSQSNPGTEVALITVKEFRCTAVKGIRQRQSEAEVEVEYSSALTPLGAKLGRMMGEEWCDECRNPQYEASESEAWHRLQQMAFGRTILRVETHHFALWDDGWRLMD